MTLEDGTTKVMSVRLPSDMAAELELVARTDRQTVSAFIRTAVVNHLANRKADEELRVKVKERLDRDRRIAERLAKSPTS